MIWPVFHFTIPSRLVAGNNPIFRKRAELLLEKGTNRLAFKKGMAISYDWQDVGSSFGASQLQAAVLYSQLQEMDIILESRKSIYELYENQLAELQFTESAIGHSP